eukprot:497288-Alexandrium_andersonii.AAC.1
MPSCPPWAAATTPTPRASSGARAAPKPRSLSPCSFPSPTAAATPSSPTLRGFGPLRAGVEGHGG